MNLCLGIASKGVGNSVFTAFFSLFSFFFAEPCFITFIIKKRKRKNKKQPFISQPFLGWDINQPIVRSQGGGGMQKTVEESR